MDPTTAAILAAAEVVSAVIGIAQGLKNLFAKKPKPVDVVAQLTPYLQAILSHIQYLQVQNAEIIRKLDKLPEILAGIIRAEIHEQGLRDSYNNLDSASLTLIGSGKEPDWELNSGYWTSVSNALTYIYRYEYRVSKIPELLVWTDFADYVSNGKLKPMFSILSKNKLEHVTASRVDIQRRYEEGIALLRKDLSSEYVASTNADTALSVELFKFEPSPDRLKSITQTKITERVIGEEDCCRTRYETIVDTWTEIVPDVQWNAVRDQTVERINISINKCVALASGLSETAAVENMMTWWIEKFESEEKSLLGPYGDRFVTVELDAKELAVNAKIGAMPFMPKATDCYGH